MPRSKRLASNASRFSSPPRSTTPTTNPSALLRPSHDHSKTCAPTTSTSSSYTGRCPPYGGDVTLPWPALEDAFTAGNARAIGLSNYERDHIEAVRSIASVPPHALQVEAHPFLPNEALRSYAHELGMVFEAWSPLARGRAVTDPTLIDIGAQLGVSAAQVALRWAIDRGRVVFPKTLSPARMAANIDTFSFSLSPDQRARIDALDEGEAGRTGSHPATMNRL